MSRKITRTCTHCGKEFQRFPSLSPNTKVFFCSRACYTAHGRVEITCCICGKTRQIEASQAGNVVTCGKECMRIRQARITTGRVVKPRIQVVCRQCGKVRMVFECHADRPFCNRKCHSAWMSEHQGGENSPVWKGGTHDQYYGPNWRAQRAKARQRDSYKCRACGAKPKGRAFDVHHIKPFREFQYAVGKNENYLQANDLTNLITLCPSCHTKAEHGYVAIQPYLL